MDNQKIINKLSDAEYKKLAKKIAKEKDYYDQESIIKEKFEYKELPVIIWYLFYENYVDINTSYELFFNNCEVEQSSYYDDIQKKRIRALDIDECCIKLVTILKRFTSIPSHISVYLNTRWERKIIPFYLHNPSIFDTSLNEYLFEIQEMFKLIKIRLGTADKKDLKISISEELCKDLPYEVHTFENNSFTAIRITENEKFTPAFYEILTNLTTLDEWAKACRDHIMKTTRDVNAHYYGEGIKIMSFEEFKEIYKRIDNESIYYTLLGLRTLSINEYEILVHHLEDKFREEHSLAALVCAVIARKKENLEIPE